jgi:ribose/xylose/arabinose/galactoside ABC-type transport system permease subunit
MNESHTRSQNLRKAFNVPRSKVALRVAIAVLIAVVLYGAVTTQGFLSIANGKAILTSVSIVGILAIGMTAIMIGGSFASLSLGASAAVMAMLFVTSLGLGPLISIALTILVGTLVGAGQGWLIGAWNANPIIMTLASGSILVGVATFITNGNTLYPPNQDFEFLNQTPLGLPVSVYGFIGVVLLVEVVFRRTVFGRQLYLVGENRKAALAAGLPVALVTSVAFAIAGACSSLAGIFLGAFNLSASMALEGNLTFDAVAATLVGGTLVTGGKGSAWQTLLGALLIGVITNILLLRGYNTGVQILVKGLLVGIVVVLIHLSSRSDRSKA